MQLLDSLVKLEQVADTVFRRIEARVGVNRTRLSNLGNRCCVESSKRHSCDRVNTAQTAVQRLVGTRNATTVFSSWKYPASDYKARVSIGWDLTTQYTNRPLHGSDLDDHPIPLSEVPFAL